MSNPIDTLNPLRPLMHIHSGYMFNLGGSIDKQVSSSFNAQNAGVPGFRKAVVPGLTSQLVKAYSK